MFATWADIYVYLFYICTRHRQGECNGDGVSRALDRCSLKPGMLDSTFANTHLAGKGGVLWMPLEDVLAVSRQTRERERRETDLLRYWCMCQWKVDDGCLMPSFTACSVLCELKSAYAWSHSTQRFRLWNSPWLTTAEGRIWSDDHQWLDTWL